jgi:hypothetical protein
MSWNLTVFQHKGASHEARTVFVTQPQIPQAAPPSYQTSESHNQHQPFPANRSHRSKPARHTPFDTGRIIKALSGRLFPLLRNH